MGFSDWMALVGAITGVVGTIAGLGALHISKKADERAAQAEIEGEKAKERALWTEVISAVQALVAVNVIRQDAQPILLRTREGITELIDGIPKEHRDVVAEWLAAEYQRIVLCMDRALLDLDGQQETVEIMIEAHKNIGAAAATLVSNLRVARGQEMTAKVKGELTVLMKHAKADVEKLQASMTGEPKDE